MTAPLAAIDYGPDELEACLYCTETQSATCERTFEEQREKTERQKLTNIKHTAPRRQRNRYNSTQVTAASQQKIQKNVISSNTAFHRKIDQKTTSKLKRVIPQFGN